MAMGACRECKKEVSSEAKTCPHCGVSAPVPRKTSAGGVLGCLVLGLLLMGWCGSMLGDDPAGPAATNGSASRSREAVIRAELRYLDAQLTPEIAWMDIDDNNVYIGFSKRLDDMSMVIRGAALRCNKAINFGCHVWAVPADGARPWRPGSGPYYEEVTARHGMIE